ncbi:MAG: ribosome silencing factor [Nitrospinae bacterium]|nr:ribosome silencing factor [Nitrospinota bacterium]
MEVNLQKKAEIGFNAVLSKKAADVLIFDIRGVSNTTDFFMVCSGESNRQVQAIADEVITKLRERGVKPMGIEGYEVAKWILLDFSDMVVHVFHEETRKYYEIERLWEGAPKVEINTLL